MSPRRGAYSWVAALAAAMLALALSGCGGDDDGTETAQPAPRQEREAERPREPERPRERPPVGDGRGGVRLERLGEFDQPLYVAQPPGEGDELFVVEKCGTVRLLRDGDVAERPFLDLSGEVSCDGGEQGLLSVAFPPDHRRSGLLYVNYTDAGGDTRVVEYRRSERDGAVVDPGSARELLRIEQPFSNHNGGLLLFGPDERLYIGTGDGGSAGDPQRSAQDLGSLLGKLLRIEPRREAGEPYRSPRANPFTDRGGARAEIYSYGLRNPWRFSFDRDTGDLWIGDVGQNDFEEVSGVERAAGAGANFGWSAFEGTARFNTDQEAPGHVEPLLTYPLDGACAVTGGYVVRDRRLRSLYGRYLYGDFCVGELRSFTARPGRPASDDRALGLRVPSLSSFGEDNAGRIYATSLEGPVYRLVPAGDGGS